ncbi:YetF domain-containing protein [Peribacillus simplex]|uniref:YetF domain-containing protein n=1 Tax=Peribacillus simplex TaxID=1478 RepID=UPI003334C2C2
MSQVTPIDFIYALVLGGILEEGISLNPLDEAPSILVIEEGQIKEEELQSLKKSKEWLLEGLRKKNYKTIEDILYGEWSETDGFFIQPHPKENS